MNYPIGSTLEIITSKKEHEIWIVRQMKGDILYYECLRCDQDKSNIGRKLDISEYSIDLMRQDEKLTVHIHIPNALPDELFTL